ncbi:MAG: hypothetical protein QF442_03335 [Candidatus Peribacteraceae bacterium]|jgi:Ca2+/Na+ antiporter|nr:hypothetical protein [Candidatus Peribacteraceae bacterium]
MEILHAFLLGVFIKFITGLDDVLTRVPVVAAVTRTHMGKMAFATGSVLAVIVATGIAYFFSSFVAHLPAYRYVVVGIVFLLAFLIYKDVFVHKPREKAEKKLMSMQKISVERVVKLIGIGFVASFATVLDDVIAFLPLFLLEPHLVLVGIVGIFVTTIAEALLVIYSAERIAKIPYKEEIAAAGLVLLGIGILLGWI